MSLDLFYLFIIHWLNLVGFTVPFILLNVLFGNGGFSLCEYLEVLISPNALSLGPVLTMFMFISVLCEFAVVKL